MKFAKGQIVRSSNYGYNYEIIEVLDLGGYVVRNLTLDGGNRNPFRIQRFDLLEHFENDAVLLEVCKSPLWKALS